VEEFRGVSLEGLADLAPLRLAELRQPAEQAVELRLARLAPAGLGVFFVDLPRRDQKDAIWGIYTRHYSLDAKQARPDNTNWTGAEIKSGCRLASLLDVPLVQAAQNVVPVASTRQARLRRRNIE
jgi:hypothetical protein